MIGTDLQKIVGNGLSRQFTILARDLRFVSFDQTEANWRSTNAGPGASGKMRSLFLIFLPVCLA
jgi:hypothetical protein